MMLVGRPDPFASDRRAIKLMSIEGVVLIKFIEAFPRVRLSPVSGRVLVPGAGGCLGGRWPKSADSKIGRRVLYWGDPGRRIQLLGIFRRPTGADALSERVGAT